MSDGVKLDEPIDRISSGRRATRLSEDAIGLLVAAIDAMSITSASILATGTYVLLAGNSPPNTDAHLGLGIVAAILFAFVAKSTGLYQFAALLGLEQCWGRVVASWLLVVLLLVLFLFLLKIGTQFSRGTVLLFAFFGPACLIAARIASTRYLRGAFERARGGRRAVVIGDRDQMSAMTRTELARRFAITELGRFTLLGLPHGGDLAGHDRSAIDKAIELARRESADEVVLAVSWSDAARLDVLRHHLRILPLPVRLLPDRIATEILKQSTFAGRQSLALELQRSPLTVAEQLQKRLFDIVVAAAALVVLSPLFALIALAVKIDSAGPAIFRQRRNGFNGRQFVIFKFRSMRVLEDGARIAQARPQDDRVTRLGRFLRRASIDELPQLLNVIRGEMSLVGPRPHALAHNDTYSNQIAEYAFRHHVKPGITGWAQINGYRGETSRIEQMRRRVEHDLWYIDNWSFGLDILILARTCVSLLRDKMAY
jgi:Undecaprenyl-phosphate glucose phosphotransferase